MFITIQELKQYIGLNTDNDEMLSIYADTGKEIIENFLGFSPISGFYDDIFSGDGGKILRLNTKPISNVIKLTIDNEVSDLENLYYKNEYLYLLNDKYFYKGEYNIRVEYEGGYDEIPSIIKMTNLRISALLFTEEDGNIGITSKSFDNTGQRSFIQNTNYNKYLSVLNKYRITGL